MVDVGSKAPAFSLVDTKREVKSLADFAGKKTVLAFFPAAFSGICDTEMCSFRDSMADLNDLNANVVGISVDAPFANAEFATRHGLQFPVLSDYRREAVKEYGVELENFAGLEGLTVAQRSVFILDEAGTVRWSWIAEKASILPDYDAIKQQLASIG